MENNRKKYLLRIAAVVAFVALFFVADRTGALLLDRCLRASQNRFSRMYTGHAGADILILGSSRGVNGFYVPLIEKELSVKAFNLSYNGMGMGLSEVMFKDYLRYNPAPRMLILEVTNVSSLDDLIYSLKLYEPWSDGIDDMMREMYPGEYAICKADHLYRFNTEMFLRAMFYMHNNDQDWINRYDIDPVYAASYKPDRDTAFEFSSKGKPTQVMSDEGVKALHQILRLASERGIIVRLSITPFLPAHVRALESNFRIWKAQLQSVVGPDYKIWDYATAVESTNCFADPLHMNIKGVNELFGLMRKDGFFAPLDKN